MKKYIVTLFFSAGEIVAVCDKYFDSYKDASKFCLSDEVKHITTSIGVQYMRQQEAPKNV